MNALFTRYLGPRWTEATDDAALWSRVQTIPDAELWQVHEHRRHRLVALTRGWMRDETVLDPRALTIGFARRFATYKRANLLFTDVERVLRLLGDADRPVQLVFAGKAHPQDKGGKELIRSIVRASRKQGLHGRVVFLEDYGMRIARAMVAGVDVWLNTPRRPHEASGTSGMKAAANGALNVSVLDGWWAEAFAANGREVGWPVGRGEEYDEAEGDGDRIEAELLYDVLEREVVPLFFARDGASGVPHGWVTRMKKSISRLVPRFNTVRMVKEYAARMYVPSIARCTELAANELAGAAALASWKRRVHESWGSVRVLDVGAKASEVRVGEAIPVEARVALGDLRPDDVAVELYYGPTLGGHDLADIAGRAQRARMHVVATNDDGTHTFAGTIPTLETGSHAFAARVMPWNTAAGDPQATSLVRWA
jgi:starch phosphorylase